MHPHIHHIVTHGYMGRSRLSDGTDGQMDEEADWWTTWWKIELPPISKGLGVGRQHNLYSLMSIDTRQPFGWLCLKIIVLVIGVCVLAFYTRSGASFSAFRMFLSSSHVYLR